GRDAIHQHVGHVVVGDRRDGEGLVRAVVHAHRTGGRDRAVGAGRGGDGAGVDREAGGDGVVGGDVGERVGGDGPGRRAIHQHVGDVVVGGGSEGEDLIAAVVRHHRAGR